MSDDALFKNAVKTLADRRKHDKVRNAIKEAKYHPGRIDDPKTFLDTLIWMGPVPEWNAFGSNPNSTGKIYEKIAPQRESRTIGAVAERILTKYGKSPEKALTSMCKQSEEFKSYLHKYVRFDPLLIGHIWVRSIRKYEEERHPALYGGEPEKKLYIVDGNHRALIYALYLKAGDQYSGDRFAPVKVLWSQSWKHILCWAEQAESEAYAKPSDRPPKELEHIFSGRAVWKKS